MIGPSSVNLIASHFILWDFSIGMSAEQNNLWLYLGPQDTGAGTNKGTPLEMLLFSSILLKLIL